MMTAQDIDAILATNVWPQLDAGAPAHRLLIGVAGMPGSGKSVMANAVAARINEARPGVATVVGMDGWHCSRAELDSFPVSGKHRASGQRFCPLTADDHCTPLPIQDPAEAHARRGAAFTFRAADFASFVAKIRNSTTLESGAKPIFAPSFDHATKDPVPNGLVVLPRNRIVLVEGIYVGMDGGSWSTAARMFDQRWWIAAEDDVLVDRLVSRHVQTGVCADAETARERGQSWCGGMKVEQLS